MIDSPVQLQVNNAPKKHPVLPPWLDFWSYNVDQRLYIICGLRTVVCTLVLTLCLGVLIGYSDKMGIGFIALLSSAAVVNVVELIITGYYIYLVRIKQYLKIRRILLSDFVVGVSFMFFVIILLCVAPANKYLFIAGFKLIIAYGFMCFRIYRAYRKMNIAAKQPIDQQHLTQES